MSDLYKGSVELISGLKQKNDVDFPLVEAHAVAVYEAQGDDTVEIRLDEKLKQLAEASDLSADVKNQIIADAENAVFDDERFKVVTNDVTYLSNSLGNWPTETEKTVFGSITDIEKTLADFEGDNEELNVTYEKTGSILYLHTGDTVVADSTDPNYNVIAETVIEGAGGGSGTTSQYKLALAAIGEQNFSILKGDSSELEYEATLSIRSQEDGVPDEVVTTENITVYLYKQDEVSGVFQLLTSRQEKADGSKKFDISQYLTKVGNNVFKITATYREMIQDEEGNEVALPISRSKTWAVEVVDMYLSSDFNDSVAITTGGNVNIPYLAYGNLSKTIYGTLNGEPYYEYITSTTGRSHTMTIESSKLSHGSYNVELWCEGLVGNKTIKSKSLKFNFMYVEPGNTTPVIRLFTESLNGEQYSNIPIYYNVYKEGVLKNDVEITINDDRVVKATVDRSEQLYQYQPTTEGEKVVTLTSGDVSKSVTLQIAEFEFADEIAPITDERLDIDFTPSGRSNQDEDYNVFKNNVVGKETTYDWTLSDNFDWVNGGWQIDAEGVPYFCVKAGTTATFNYNLFDDANTIVGPNNAKGNGKEFKLIFKTDKVANPDATWLECMALPDLGTQEVGIKMTMHNGYISSSVEQLTIPYSEEDKIEFDMNIVPMTIKNGLPDLTVPDIPMIITYEDGTPAQPKVISSAATSFKQANAVPITVGSPYGDVHIYRMKIYNKFLQESEVLDNYIADAPTGAEIANRFKYNQIVDAQSGKITAEILAEKCPDLKIIKLSAPRFTYDKKDKVKNTTIQFIHKNGRPEDNWIATGCVHNGQGTSSNAYGYAGRNLEFDLRKATITLQDGANTQVSEISLSKDSYPTNYLNLKVNIASTDHTNNALLQKRYDRYLPYTSAAELRDSRLKNTMNFFNAVLFIREEGGDLGTDDEGNAITQQEFNDNEWHFYSIGNIGDSKKTDETRTSDPEDDNEFCVEIMDWNRYLSKFPTDTIILAPKGKQNTAGEWQYDGRVKDELKEFLLFKQEDGSYVNAFTKEEAENPDIHVDMEAEYYIDILEHDDFSEDYTYGFRYTKGDDDNLDTDPIIAKNKAKWIEIYRFLTKPLNTQAEIDAWKKELPNWVNMDAAFYYYLFTLRYTMVDNRAKNSFWHWGKCEDGQYRLDFWDYDNDTALGIDNAGKLEMTYGVEDLDGDPNQAEGESATYFRAGDSQFFMRLVNYFGGDMITFMSTLESQNNSVFDAESLIEEFDKSQSMFPERLWHEQYKRGYKRTYVGGTGDLWDNAKVKAVDKRFLSEMWNGKKKYQRRQFERNQEIYMSSKFLGSKNLQSTITLRGAGDLSGANLNPAPDPTITITPYLNMYINLGREINGNPYYSQRCKAGQTYIIPYPQDVLEFLYVRGANRIQSLGDLSKMYLQTATLASGEKLKEIILGNSLEGYNNKNLTELNIASSNEILELLDLRNISTLTGDLPVTAIPSLRKIYAQGTSFLTATLPNRGLLEEVYLPSTLNTLIANNLYYLSILELESYENLGKLVVDNCPKINVLDLVQKSENLKIVRLTNIDWQLQTTDLLNRLLACRGIGEDGSTEIEQSVLTGKVHVEAIRQSEIDKYEAAWPGLEISWGMIIPQHKVIFTNKEDGNKSVEILVDEGTTLNNSYGPEQSGLWLSTYGEEKPQKANSSDGQYSYVFNEWKTVLGQSLSQTTITNEDVYFDATFTEVKRKYIVRWWPDIAGSSANKQPLQETEVEWGQNANYTGATPTKSMVGNVYSLFDSWDKSSTNITTNRDIYPVWETSNPYTIGSIDSNQLKATDVFALRTASMLDNYFNIAGDKLTLQTGYMPSYNNVEEEVLISSKTEFDGTAATVINTGIKLFEKDQSFTLAIDYAFGYDYSVDQVLVSGSYHSDRNGFALKIPTISGTSARVIYKQDNNFKTIGFKAPEENRQHREICVIKKVKGDNNLYIYRHDRYNFNSKVEKIIHASPVNSFNETAFPLSFGGIAGDTGGTSDFSKGVIYYSKLWWESLEDNECENICSWIYDTLEFEYVGATTGIYPYANGEGDSKKSFLASYLLDEPMAFHDTRSAAFSNAYETSKIRTWLREKVFKGVNLKWQQVIAPVRVTSFTGKPGTSGSASVSGDTKYSYDNYFYLPAVAELANITKDFIVGSISFNAEINNKNAYEIMPDQESRLRTYKDSLSGENESYWTRTPGKEGTYGYYLYNVVKHGPQYANMSLDGEQGPGALALNDSYQGNNYETVTTNFEVTNPSYVLLGFSI